jgi:hypothetical protein
MRALVACAGAIVLLGCGGTADADASIRSTVVNYFGALTHARPRTACAQLTEASQEKLADFGFDVLKTHSKSCSATYRMLFASVAGPRLRHLGHPRITRVTRDGGHATVHVDGLGTPIKLAHTKDGWRIDSEPAVEPDKAPAAEAGR